MPVQLNWPDLLERLEADRNSKLQSSGSQSEDKIAWESLEQAVRSLSQHLLSPRWGLARDDVEDILQQILLKFQSLETLRRVRSAGNAEGYIAVMLKNAAMDILRRREVERKLFRPLDTELPQSGSNEISDRSDDRRADLKEELRLLPAEDRALLRMRFWRNMSIQQIARETGLTYSAAAVRLFRIVHRMRAHMEQ
ncbi:MAG: sigma-70 family RNA polymerase sigma factor [Candidatus Angelobacter sp.]